MTRTRPLSLLLLLASLAVCGCEPKEKPKIVAFTASWCAACHADEPRLQLLERQGYTIQRIDYDINPDLVRRFQVTELPSYFLNGQRVSLP